ncbi:hypothetical protein Q5752_002297 [Cryptotrichosporon argae]
MRPSLRVFALLLALLGPLSILAAAQDVVECPDDSLTTYLVSLLDVLYSSSLSIYEQLVVSVSETDGGYDLLLSLYNSTATSTLLPPSDAAFAAAGITGFDGWAEADILDLFALHVFKGTQDDTVPAYPLDGIGTTYLSIAAQMNSTTRSDADQVVVLVANGTGVSVVQASSNVSSWSTQVDVSNAGLGNIAILPLDGLLSAPPNITTALSDLGLTSFAAELADGLDALEQLTPDGFTIFAPVDAAWTNETVGAVKANSSLLTNLYTTSYTLYSPAWYDSGAFPSLALDSGAAASVTYNGTGHYVTLGSVTAAIVRADVPLENGVMHIVDRVLFDTAASTDDTATSGTVDKCHFHVFRDSPKIADETTSLAQILPFDIAHTF